MERRKFVIGLGALAAGGAAAVGSGAFNIATAEREVEVNVAGDEDAYLGLEAVDEAYAQGTTNGTLELDFSGEFDGQNGDGVNDEALTVISDLFKVTNQGTDDIQLTVANADEAGDPQSSGYTNDDINNPIFMWSEDKKDTTNILPGFRVGGQLTGPKGEDIGLEPGDSVYVHVAFDTTEAGSNETPLDDPDDPSDLEAINFYAQATDSPPEPAGD